MDVVTNSGDVDCRSAGGREQQAAPAWPRAPRERCAHWRRMPSRRRANTASTATWRRRRRLPPLLPPAVLPRGPLDAPPPAPSSMMARCSARAARTASCSARAPAAPPVRSTTCGGMGRVRGWRVWSRTWDAARRAVCVWRRAAHRERAPLPQRGGRHDGAGWKARSRCHFQSREGALLWLLAASGCTGEGRPRQQPKNIQQGSSNGETDAVVC